MILGTWGAAWAGYHWGPWAAVVGGLVFGALGGLLHAVATVTFGVNHIVSGVAITLLGAGRHQVPVDADVPAGLAEPAAVAAGRGLRHVLGRSRSPTGSAELEAEQRVLLSDVAGLLGGLVTGLTPLVVLGVRCWSRSATACCGGPGSGCGCARAGRTRWPPSRWA